MRRHILYIPPARPLLAHTRTHAGHGAAALPAPLPPSPPRRSSSRQARPPRFPRAQGSAGGAAAPPPGCRHRPVPPAQRSPGRQHRPVPPAQRSPGCRHRPVPPAQRSPGRQHRPVPPDQRSPGRRHRLSPSAAPASAVPPAGTRWAWERHPPPSAESTREAPVPLQNAQQGSEDDCLRLGPLRDAARRAESHHGPVEITQPSGPSKAGETKTCPDC
ncbi:uncharacterized protein LOC143693655 [Agelaius phoeniceus]|uniref:uncharacterized protein LOC143693655 n=1 Tax=Agelaius phoeniceus TaxID=39638 RepID=UPI004054B24B